MLCWGEKKKCKSYSPHMGEEGSGLIKDIHTKSVSLASRVTGKANLLLK